MDMKFKIVIVLFIILLVGYAIYFVVRDFSNQRKNDKIEKRITESFENYDARTNILQQLDSFKVDKKIKNAVFQTMSKNIEKYQDMPEDTLKEYIADIIKETKKDTRAKKAVVVEEEKPETYANETDGEDDEEPVEDFTQAPLVKGLAEKPRAEQPEAGVTKQDIADAIDKTSMHISNLEKDLIKIKGLVTVFTSQQDERNSTAKAPPEPTQTVKKPNAGSADINIEGFENFGGRGYSFI